MAKEKPEVKKVAKPKPEIKPKKEKKHYFPKIFFVYGLLLILVAINEYFKWWSVPEIVKTILFLFTGMWYIKMGISKGFYKKRKEIFKKYI